MVDSSGWQTNVIGRFFRMADQRQQRRDARDRVKGIAEAQAEARKFLRSLRADITSCKEWVDTLDLPDGYWRHITFCFEGFPSWIDDWFKRQEQHECSTNLSLFFVKPFLHVNKLYLKSRSTCE